MILVVLVAVTFGIGFVMGELHARLSQTAEELEEIGERLDRLARDIDRAEKARGGA